MSNEKLVEEYEQVVHASRGKDNRPEMWVVDFYNMPNGVPSGLNLTVKEYGNETTISMPWTKVAQWGETLMRLAKPHIEPERLAITYDPNAKGGTYDFWDYFYPVMWWFLASLLGWILGGMLSQ